MKKLILAALAAHLALAPALAQENPGDRPPPPPWIFPPGTTWDDYDESNQPPGLPAGCWVIAGRLLCVDQPIGDGPLNP
jgi:hypothetical protein